MDLATLEPRRARAVRRAAALAAVAVCLPAAALADDTRVAAADEPAPPAEAPPPPLTPPAFAPPQLAPPLTVERPAPAPAALTPIEQRRAIVGAGRGLAGNTALTVPAGRVEVSMRSFVPFAGLITVSAGLGSTTELSAEVGGIDDGGATVAFGVGAKQVLAKRDRMQVSIGGTLRRLQDTSEESYAIMLAQVGGTLSACVTEPCSLMVSAGVSGLYITDEGSMPVFSLGLSAGGRTTRLLAEAYQIERVSVVMGGIRFGSESWCGELGLVTVVIDEGTGVVPYAGFSARM
jgi:hypothetical protein